MLNLPYFPMIYFDVLKTGATIVLLNVLLKKNEIAYHLKDSNAKPYFSFIGTPELPMGKEAWTGFNQVDTCNNFWLVIPPGVDNPIEGATTLSELMANQPPTFEALATEASDSAVILHNCMVLLHFIPIIKISLYFVPINSNCCIFSEKHILISDFTLRYDYSN